VISHASVSMPGKLDGNGAFRSRYLAAHIRLQGSRCPLSYLTTSFLCLQRLRLFAPVHLRKPKLLILDVNGLLVHRVYAPQGGSNASRVSAGPPGTLSCWAIGNFLIYLRPSALEFCR
jgi:hypothetical protein